MGLAILYLEKAYWPESSHYFYSLLLGLASHVRNLIVRPSERPIHIDAFSSLGRRQRSDLREGVSLTGLSSKWQPLDMVNLTRRSLSPVVVLVIAFLGCFLLQLVLVILSLEI